MFSFQVNSKIIHTSSSEQPKYQILQLFSRWAALDNKIYAEDPSLNKKFKGINFSKEAIEIFIKTFAAYPKIESLLYYVIYEQGETVVFCL